MMLPPLTIIPAGAGSGKTYTIQQTLAEWVETGQVSPERIVAVTFTEAAASELRERIKSKLLELGRLEDAIKLDQAYISTIHGFGKRLLAEFAFDVGMSPNPRLLDEDEESTLLRQALAKTDKADAIISNLSKYGYNFEFNSGKSAEDVFRDDLLRVVALLRSLGWDKESDHYVKAAHTWIKSKYGKAFNGDHLADSLHAAVKALLDEFPENLSGEYGSSATAEQAFNSDFSNLHKALDRSLLDADWKIWKGLRGLRLSKRGCKLPNRYEELGNAVIDAASKLAVHSGPLNDALTHIESLLAAGQDVLVHYAEAKREAGLIDYSDMIAIAEKMLKNNQTVMDTMVSRIDCLVVDEFQDTNPLQFAMLWHLTQAGVPTITVGDLKQAIMGFQGADPRLFATMIEQNEEIASPLTKNWRSQPKIMDFVNVLGPQLFGDEYVDLEPKGAESELAPLEAIVFPDKARRDNHQIRAAYVGERLLEILSDQKLNVLDKTTGLYRDMYAADIAILCPTRNLMMQYAEVLRAQGLKVKIQESGWYSSRVIELAINALMYVSNPEDKHAALYLSVTDLGNSTLQSAIEQLLGEGSISDPILENLRTLSELIEDRTIFGVVADVLDCLGLFNVILTWTDSQQARADLLRLQAEAGEFMDANRDALASGGFHGAGIQSFISWLIAKVEKKDGDNRPEPAVVDQDAIEIVTWHASKGREWPVVVVAGTEKEVKPFLPNMELGYSDFEELSSILQTAQVQFSPKFPAPEADDRFLEELREAADLSARRLLYVALTRAREKLILEWPTYQDGKDSHTYWSILAVQAGMSVEKDEVKIKGTRIPCQMTFGRPEFPDGFNLDNRLTPEKLPIIGRRSIQPGIYEGVAIPDSVSPSGLKEVVVDDGSEVQLEELNYHSGAELSFANSAIELGNLFHLGFELLGSDSKLISRMGEISRVVLEDDDKEKLVEIVDHFEAFVADHFKPKSVSRELPILTLDARGSVVSGIADYVVETEEGIWIIDHKSDSIDDFKEGFKIYQSQLGAYASAFSSIGSNVLGVGVNWIRLGTITTSRL